MAKITLTYEDNQDGTVRVVLDPPANELFARFKSSQKMTTAESMVVMELLPMIAQSFKSNYEDRRIVLPDSMS